MTSKPPGDLKLARNMMTQSNHSIALISLKEESTRPEHCIRTIVHLKAIDHGLGEVLEEQHSKSKDPGAKASDYTGAGFSYRQNGKGRELKCLVVKTNFWRGDASSDREFVLRREVLSQGYDGHLAYACWQKPATFLGSQGRSPQYKVSGGPEGQELGRGGLAKSSSTWPDLLSAEVSPGYFDQTGKVAVVGPADLAKVLQTHRTTFTVEKTLQSKQIRQNKKRTGITLGDNDLSMLLKNSLASNSVLQVLINSPGVVKWDFLPACKPVSPIPEQTLSRISAQNRRVISEYSMRTDTGTTLPAQAQLTKYQSCDSVLPGGSHVKGQGHFTQQLQISKSGTLTPPCTSFLAKPFPACRNLSGDFTGQRKHLCFWVELYGKHLSQPRKMLKIPTFSCAGSGGITSPLEAFNEQVARGRQDTHPKQCACLQALLLSHFAKGIKTKLISAALIAADHIALMKNERKPQEEQDDNLTSKNYKVEMQIPVQEQALEQPLLCMAAGGHMYGQQAAANAPCDPAQAPPAEITMREATYIDLSF
ncbi:hypothetical protein Anapl_02026 [Anas platyrhynchos]|uniref:Uncharacterized protein n=1 Tax=Anas platyrhynchos TaxID=8839 RepID=R0M065_ANAPL|nr:hypothetical protein Anapl_02026 [Anas platyrhynchos]